MNAFILIHTLHRGAFCQSSLWWIYYYGSNKITGKEAGKMQLCTVVHTAVLSLLQKGSVLAELYYYLQLYNNSVSVLLLCNNKLLTHIWRQLTSSL